MGLRVDVTRVEEEGRPDPQPRVVAAGRGVGSRASGELAMGARTRRASTERVREFSGNARRPGADELRRHRSIEVRRVVGGGATEGRWTHGHGTAGISGGSTVSPGETVSVRRADQDSLSPRGGG